jgi:hypothetical protein
MRLLAIDASSLRRQPAALRHGATLAVLNRETDPYGAGLPLPRAAAGEHGFGEDRRRAARRASTCELGQHLRTRLQPIRTVCEVLLDFPVFTQEPSRFQAIRAEAQAMRQLGMTLNAIATALGVSDKTVRKALAALTR